MAAIFSLNAATFSFEWYCLVGSVNGEIPQFLKIKKKKNTVSEINNKVSLFLELEFQKLEFLINFATVALLSWICVIKKNFAVLELDKLEYHLHNTQVYQA